MYAVIKSGGKQYRVAEGDVLRIEKLSAETGETIKFDEVLLVADGDKVQVGTPRLDGGSVSAEVLEQGRARKIEVVKFKRRKDYERHHGHRQQYTEVRITGIKAG
ncbi:MAG: 50S ribosomal protein L21 [Spiribacter salinus]|jgi:large subunit ribosomal protein L21|uniref:Large ribosomal subunit protein bL21 n=1 Tax=Spiribacter salinus TaxID=1335746 RepID=A0A540VVJ8_9GAMM|nr:50S ribosomal protein L21 [Spiribacter sp.]MDR9454724.1 50S ribosomal protein L21 [Spiribacter sp.]TQF00792.1 MAG: 50S ribosomal protein L21 [Spiribacter salinus]